jgi:hypothetical protein
MAYPAPESSVGQELPLATGGFSAAFDGRRNGAATAQNAEIADGRYPHRHMSGPTGRRDAKE